MYGYQMMSGAGWVLMALLWLVVIALGVWAIVHFTSTQRAAQPTGPAPERPRDILDRRLAGGEIDVRAYEEQCTKLEGRSGAPEGEA
jgi:uncharacterized membrane protein